MTPVQQVQRCTCNESKSVPIRGDHVHCCTFVEIASRVGTDRATLAGACHRSDCRFTDMMECPASSVEVGAGAERADYPTYAAR
jgi:hypothetical protein